MIVKILGRSASFNGVRYNTDKVKTNRGELLVARNFGALEHLDNPRPQDYINYLKAWSSSSTKIRFPQLHVAISAKGHSHDKKELAELAEAWLKEMGYGQNPYLLIFHKDTHNNHIHLVSSRIGKNGKKISDSFEKIRSYKALDRVMGIKHEDTFKSDLTASLHYTFSTVPQWMMLLEAKGYTVRNKDGAYEIIKFGRLQDKVSAEIIHERIEAHQKDSQRIAQLRAVFIKYKSAYNPALVKEIKSEGQQYTSELCQFLSDNFGIEIRFHVKAGLPPYGYTVIDHARKQVFKGGEILQLPEFLDQQNRSGVNETPNDDQRFFSTYLLKNDQPGFSSDSGQQTFLPQIYIAPDMDDDQVHGPRRRRKRKARTNTR